MNKNRTLVLGASTNPERTSYLAVKRLASRGYAIAAIGNRAGKIGEVEIITEKKAFEDIDTVTLYLNPIRQQAYYEYILSLRPRRIIFNPGSENEELTSLAREKGIQALEACTLVLLSTGQY